MRADAAEWCRLICYNQTLESRSNPLVVRATAGRAWFCARASVMKMLLLGKTGCRVHETSLYTPVIIFCKFFKSVTISKTKPPHYRSHVLVFSSLNISLTFPTTNLINGKLYLKRALQTPKDSQFLKLLKSEKKYKEICILPVNKHLPCRPLTFLHSTFTSPRGAI